MKGKKGKAANMANETAAAIAEQSTEMMLQMFGKDGGAYMRGNDQRNCRDLPMCISLAMYWGAMLWLLGHAMDEGDIDKLFYPVTFEGVACGVDATKDSPPGPDLTEYKRLYYPVPTQPELNFCVQECPGKGTPKFDVPFPGFSTWICHHDIELRGRYAPGTEMDQVGYYQNGQCNPASIPPFVQNGTSGYIGDIDMVDVCDNPPLCTKTVQVSRPCQARGRPNCELPGQKEAVCNWMSAVCGNSKQHLCDLPLMSGAGCAPNPCGQLQTATLEPEGAGMCYKPYGATKDILYQCIPMELGEQAVQLAQEMSGDMGSQHFNDLMEFGWVVGVSFGVALVLSFAWILFLDYFAGPLIWFTVYATLVMLPTVGGVLLWKAGAIEPPAEMLAAGGAEMAAMQAKMAEVQVDPKIATYAAYGCFIATIVLGIIFQIFHDRITMSIGVIEEASDCFLAIPKCILTPIITAILQVPVVIYGVYSSLYLLSMRQYEPDTGGYIYGDSLDPDRLKKMVAFSAFGCLWTGYVFMSVQYTTIAGACADWYFTFETDGERHVKMFAVERSFYRVCRYNFGSMIFGALLIAVVAVMKWIAVYCIQQVMAQSPENKVIQLLGACLICVVNCVERLIRFLGKLAYIEIAIYGMNFCTGIYSASKRLIKNMVRFSFLSVFAHLMIFMGKVGVVVGTVFICEMIMTQERETTAINPPYAPLLFCGLAAALTVMLIMSVYETAIDTIMMCFLEDESENTGDKPSFATGELAQFMTSTKSIADAAEAYAEESRQAKTNKIRADDASQEELKNQHAGIQAAREGRKGGGRSAKKRKAEKGGGGSQGKKINNPLQEE